MKFTQELNDFYQRVRKSIIARVAEKGQNSRFHPRVVVRVDNERAFNLSNDRCLFEVGQNELIDNEGYVYGYGDIGYGEIVELADWLEDLKPIPTLKNKDIIVGKLGQERKFISGGKNWRTDFAELEGNVFKKGVKVSFFDEDEQKNYTGEVEWIIVTESGDVEVSIANTPLGRIDLELLEIQK